MKRYFSFLVLIALFSCQEEVDLPLATIDEAIPVIEGVWTDKDYYNEVKITLAKNYFDTTARPIISDAEVFVMTPERDMVIKLTYYPETESYKSSDNQVVAEIGRTYELHVAWQDKYFVSSGTMLAPPILDSLTYEFKEERLFFDEGYFIKAYGKIPFEDDNYYRIRVIENDSLKNSRDDYLLFDDTFGLKFFEEGLELGYAFDEGDRVRMELFRMNRDVYNYFTELVGLLYNDGGLFSPPPQNPDNNIRIQQGGGDVLGYFMVSPVLSETVLIRE
ncbi:DUF4249 family protein [Algoriphagus zhangzhouensis]|uniref:DUF4249 domain-containing protein n=1 Tax=Algoriphagus zhangzhouensis TaxID=1073327 RepID=A0A1M7Z4D2_9BACT|nr:DUF4249 family protein [Algoriphagus zhangzhouensis]TDY48587.1 uncharacterized protein DUF4249 [Algoriphagus zhangzhouensis]SHO59650.1 protein of unknown function [Algoriphagus zhangzhouensis]